MMLGMNRLRRGIDQLRTARLPEEEQEEEETLLVRPHLARRDVGRRRRATSTAPRRSSAGILAHRLDGLSRAGFSLRSEPLEIKCLASATARRRRP